MTDKLAKQMHQDVSIQVVSPVLAVINLFEFCADDNTETQQDKDSKVGHAKDESKLQAP